MKKCIGRGDLALAIGWRWHRVRGRSGRTCFGETGDGAAELEKSYL